MKIAVDFDGTIVKHAYPNIGSEIPFAFKTLKMLQKEHHQLILWTVREGQLLDEAVEHCRQNGIEFYAVNANNPDELLGSESYSRKIKADIYIDDLGIGGLPDWGQIYEMIHKKINYRTLITKQLLKPENSRRKIWFFSK